MKKRTSILGYGKLHQRMESRSRAMSRGRSISDSLEVIEALFADLKQRQKAIGRAIWLSVCKKFAFGLSAFSGGWDTCVKDLVERARYLSSATKRAF